MGGKKKLSREKNLLKNTAVLSLGTFLPKLAAMVTIPLLTGYLTTTEYGTYDLINTLVSLLLPAVTLQIQSAAFRFLIKVRDNQKEICEIVSNIFSFTLTVSLGAVVLLYFALYQINSSIRFEIVIYFIMDIILVTLRQIARGLGDNFGYSLNAITNSIIMMLLTAFELLVCHNGLSGVLIALIGSTVWSIIFLSARIKIFKYFSIKTLSIKKLKELLAYSWPMVPNNLSNWVLSLSDRFIITSFIGLEANAVYAVANKIPNLFKSFQSTFMFAWQENASLAVEDKDSEEYYTIVFDGTFDILVAAMACLIASSPILFRILVRGSYQAAYYQMSILYLGVFFSSIAGFIGGIYIAHMKTKSVGITTLLAAICNLLIDFMLIRKIGIYAGSISTLVSYFLLAVFRMVNVQKFQPIKYKYGKIILSIIFLGVMSIVSFQNNFMCAGINILLAIAISYVLNRKILFVIWKKMLKKIKGGVNK